MALEQSNLFNSHEPEPSFFSIPKKIYIIGNPDRPGVKKAVEDIKRKLSITTITEKPNSFKFVKSAKSTDEIYNNLIEVGIKNEDDNELVLGPIGGDGLDSTIFEIARKNFKNATCLLTNRVGTAKDLYWNVSKNNKGQKPTELYPLEITINDTIHAAYNIGSIGTWAEMAEKFNDLPRSSYSYIQLIKNGLIAVKKISNSKTFTITTNNKTIENVTDLILTNSQRSGVVFHSKQNDIHDKTAGEHLLTNNNPTFIGKVILSAIGLYKFTPNQHFNSNDNIEYYIEGEEMRFQRDGESIEIPNKANVSVKIAKKPVRVLTI